MDGIDINAFKKLSRKEKIRTLEVKTDCAFNGSNDDELACFFNEWVSITNDDGEDLTIEEMTNEELIAYACRFNRHLKEINEIMSAKKASTLSDEARRSQDFNMVRSFLNEECATVSSFCKLIFFRYSKLNFMLKQENDRWHMVISKSLPIIDAYLSTNELMTRLRALFKE